MPPGFGTLEQNGLSGAKISRRGKLSGGRGASAVGASYPSDPYGTGLTLSGGLPNGHPEGSGNNKNKKRKERKQPSAAAGPTAARKTAPRNSRTGTSKPARSGHGNKGVRGGAKGDDWQPKSASAHESRLGVLK